MGERVIRQRARCVCMGSHPLTGGAGAAKGEPGFAIITTPLRTKSAPVPAPPLGHPSSPLGASQSAQSGFKGFGPTTMAQDSRQIPKG